MFSPLVFRTGDHPFPRVDQEKGEPINLLDVGIYTCARIICVSRHQACTCLGICVSKSGYCDFVTDKDTAEK